MLSASEPYFGLVMLLNPVVLKIFTTRAPPAHFATCSAPEGLLWGSPCGELIGLVQSRRILPASFPALRIASSIAAQGTVKATTSPEAGLLNRTGLSSRLLH